MSVTWFRFLKYLYALYFSKVQWWCQDKKYWILSGVAAFGSGGLHKLAKVKGSNHVLRSRILLPLPKTRRNSPRSKAATTPQRQDFAASAIEPMKLAKVKGSNHASEAGFCCLCRRPEETRQGQRQQPCLKKQDFAAFGLDGGLFMPGWPCKAEDFYKCFRDFCGILLSENYFFVLLRMSSKHKSAHLCTVLTMFDEKDTNAPERGNYYRIVTKY